MLGVHPGIGIPLLSLHDAPVTRSGTATSKIACCCAEVGDALKTTAQFTPI